MDLQRTYDNDIYGGVWLEAEIKPLRSRKADASEVVSKYDNILAGLPSRSSLEQEIASLERRLNQAKAELKRAETPPPGVIQSLPEDNDLANAALFFLYKPDVLRLLSRMTIKAQQMLLPWPWCCNDRLGSKKTSL